MVNGSRYYRALESMSIASALSTALTIYPCQIRVHQHWQSKLQLPTARKEWPVDSSPQAVNTVIHTTLVGLDPQPSDCWSDALPVVPPTHRTIIWIVSEWGCNCTKTGSMQTNQTSGREGQLLHRCHLQFVDFVGEYNSQCLTLLTLSLSLSPSRYSSSVWPYWLT